ncbi:PREDICTED: uncharacterized protein LOC105115274 [Populus euphratica]|uniref:Uncharacterized protein LOC105115274 n=1 Tax=Populus euphratica TaxID=75702 RepID=A0AAJ6X9K2_POPEU|nr:PREDICTED: uncharacterized protein LOC105115274 [Populus euphratica]
MGTYSSVVNEAYLAALEGDWNRMILAYHGQNYVYVMLPVTVSKDTSFHLAVYSERREPLQGLLGIVNRNPTLGNPLTKKNTYGNTVLHEAVVAGNMEAVKLLLQIVPREQGEFHPSEQLQARNMLGETTLYRAASCGNKEMVEYLARLPGQISYGKLLEDHRKRGDLTPILHAAIQGQHFETALTLLKLDPSLGDMTDDQGMTCLHLLADMPSAFKSGYAIPTISIRKLLYCWLSAPKGDGCDQSRSKRATRVQSIGTQSSRNNNDTAHATKSSSVNSTSISWKDETSCCQARIVSGLMLGIGR